MGRWIRLLIAALLGAIFLGLAMAMAPASHSASHRVRTVAAQDTASIRYLNTARARLVAAQMPTVYVVHRGDTLSQIAAQVYGSSRAWPALWWVNRHRVRNPNMIGVGQHLRLSAWHPHRPWLDRMARAAIPRARPAPAPAAAPTPAAVSYGAGAPGSFQACVIARESGGNPTAVNPTSGAGGLYQFLPSTWAALGHSGLPENASVAEQNQAFAQAYAQSGTSPWAPYDGC